MGGLVCRLVESAGDLELAARIGSADPLERAADADVLVDVTRPDVSPDVVAFALDRRIRAVVGTSGWSGERIASVRRRVEEDAGLGVLFVPNFSLGSVLATSFAALAARYFDSIEIVEAHHEDKLDSPSGTAVRTAELMGAARAEIGPVAAPRVDQRARGQQVASIPVHSIRMRGVSARQEVHFGADGERLTLAHEVFSPEAYAPGILLAIRAAPDRPGVTVGLDALLDLGIGGPAA